MRAPAFAWIGVLSALGLSAAIAAGCGSSREATFDDITPPDRGPGAELDGLQSIEVTPKEADLVAGDTNTSQAFTATGRFKDGSTKDVTASALWRVSKDQLLSMNGATATPTGTRGGITTLSASAGGITGDATVRVRWVKTILQPGAAPGSDARFKGTTDDAKLAPAVAYPLSGSLLPPNLPPIEVQWKPAAGTDLFDVSFVGSTLDLHLITPCNAIATTGGCGLAIDQNTWTNITATLAGDDPADVIVKGAGATAGVSGASAKVATQVTNDDIKGGLYYFTTRANAAVGEKPGIYRYDFKTSKVGSFYTAGQCAGCHALSKDGTKMLAPVCTDARGCGRPLALAVVDVATKQVVSPAMPVGDSDTQTWSPDNKFYITTPSCGAIDANGACSGWSGGVMSLVEAATGAKVSTVPAGPGAMYPSFSNDGKHVVYARGGSYRAPLSIQKSSLFIVDFDTTKNPPAFSAEKLLLQAGNPADFENNYHPSFSPDDKWVLFTRSFCKAGVDDPNAGDINANVCETYNDYTARTWIMPSAGGNAVECARANGEGRNIVSWPKWSPFKSTYKGGDIFWYTVSSTRDYGFRALHEHDAKGNPTSGVQQLWLVGVDPKKVGAGQDPSFAIVWLPFQDVASSNHIGQWTEQIIGDIVK